MPSSWNTIVTAATWACWGLVGLVWAVGDTLGRQRGPATQQRAGHDSGSLVGVVAALVALATPEALWHALSAGSSWVRAPGLVMLAAATVVTVWARVALGTMWSSAVVTKEHHRLRTSGPYRVTRHPIYTGILGMLLGTALLEGLGRWAALFVAVALALQVKIGAEERLLTKQFPEEYERYRQQVPQLIPVLHRRRGRRPAAGAREQRA
jgi:protein-S-isoprenylcysteine O-methyltransferase Ste14